MPKYSVAVQYRSVRTITVEAKDSGAAAEKASKRIEKTGRDVIACHVEPIDAT